LIWGKRGVRGKERGNGRVEAWGRDVTYRRFGGVVRAKRKFEKKWDAGFV